MYCWLSSDLLTILCTCDYAWTSTWWVILDNFISCECVKSVVLRVQLSRRRNCLAPGHTHRLCRVVPHCSNTIAIAVALVLRMCLQFYRVLLLISYRKRTNTFVPTTLLCMSCEFNPMSVRLKWCWIVLLTQTGGRLDPIIVPWASKVSVDMTPWAGPWTCRRCWCG